MKKKMSRRIAIAACSLSFLLTGCADRAEPGQTKVVLTAGFEKDEVFKLESLSGTLPELMVYLVNMQNQYESVYGREVLTKDLDGMTLEDSIRENVLANLVKIKAMNLLAQKYGVVLDTMEEQLAGEAAEAYYGSLNAEELAVMGVTKELLADMYEEYALANKVYEYIIKDINPEISDDEARTITVDYILIRTYTTDGTGAKIEYSPEDRREAYELACRIMEEARSEEADFKELVLKYSEGDKGTYSFGKGETEPEFEEAAFQLANGELSELIETESGYYIIKCLSTFDKEQTSANKVKIVEEKKEEVFGEEYDAFAAGLTKDLNEELWDSVRLSENEQVTTQDFFEVYHRYFG